MLRLGGLPPKLLFPKPLVNLQCCVIIEIIIILAAAKTTKKPKKKVSVGKKPKKSVAAKKGFKKTRVAAKKTTVRAPASNVKPLNNYVEEAIAEQEQEMDKISIGSISLASSRSAQSLEEEEIIEKPKARGRPRKSREPNESTPVVSAKSASAKAVKAGKKAKKTTDPEAPKNKGGRPKRSRSPPGSPRRFSPGKPPRVIHPFLGGQRLAAIAKDTFINNTTAQAIVVEKAVFEVGKQRRKRIAWSATEIEALQDGVRIYGESAWSAIINDLSLRFHPHRTQVDLKDKWRNLTAYKAYHEHPIRGFVLVNTRHEEILSPSGNPHLLNNRWPRDAALKMSTKDWIYPVDERGARSDSALIHLKEVMDAQGRSWRPQVVHVYRVTRILQKPRNIKKFSKYEAVWTGKVDKIAEEMLIKSDEILSLEEQHKRDEAMATENPQSSPKSPKSPSKAGNMNNFNLNL